MKRKKPASVVVSSDDYTRQELGRAFREQSWQVHEGGSLAALKRAVAPDWSGVVMTESTLSDGTWRDVLALTEAVCPEARVIVMSNHADDELWGEVLREGACDLIAKPLNRAEAVQAVGTALKQSA